MTEIRKTTILLSARGDTFLCPAHPAGTRAAAASLADRLGLRGEYTVEVMEDVAPAATDGAERVFTRTLLESFVGTR